VYSLHSPNFVTYFNHPDNHNIMYKFKTGAVSTLNFIMGVAETYTGDPLLDVVGKQADIVAVDLSPLDATPCYDPVSHLVHAVGREAVTDVWVAGKRVVTGRALTTVDEGSIVARARLWQERLQ
jgi:hypothetical protein